MEKNIKIILIILILSVVYLCFENRKIKEKMSDTTNIRDEINRIYKADVQSIRNLEAISKKLQDGGLTIAGDLTVDGNIKVKKNLNVDEKITSKGDITSKGNLNVSGSSKVKSLEVVNSSKFGTGSNRRLEINSTNYSNTGTYISFYNGGTRLGYIIPNTSNVLTLSGMRMTVPRLDSASIPGYLKNGTKFKFKSIDWKNGRNNVVWSNGITGNGNERGLSVRRGHSGDVFQISHVY